MGHNHHHNSDKNLGIAFFLNLIFALVEVVGGILTNSVAIISDALHDLGDSLSLGIAWFLDRKSRKRANSIYTFGYERFSLLGALINSTVLIIGSFFIVSEAIERLQHPESSNAQGMFILALLGIAVNGYAAYRMKSGTSMNEKVVTLHLLEDVLGWVAVLIGSIILLFKDIPYIDPALSLIILVYILFNVVKRLKETLHIFLQGVPHDVDVKEIESKLLEIELVQSLHHTHIWSLDGEHHVFSTHLKLKEIRGLHEVQQIKLQTKEVLQRYDFAHYTIETEFQDEQCIMLLKK